MVSWCDACGAEFAEGTRRCPDCGAPVGDAARSPIGEPPRHLATWAGVVLGGLAVVVLVVVGFRMLTWDPAAAEPTSTTTSTTTTTTLPPPDEPIQALELVDVPVTAPVTIERPPIDRTARLHHDGQLVVVEIVGEACGSGGGTLGASGTLTNRSPVGQTLDFTLVVDLVRTTTGSRMERIAVDLPAVAPGETVPWTVEAQSPRKVKLRCVVAELTVAPTS
ncbi:MAG TPA: hypothetical protein ENK55_01875 [Actinobacteria bacterium]|nr:hypothetical protein [Actinomycetota bacterium]